MVDVLIGIGCGMIVCVFGMWCFIHGQQNAISITRNELPAQINNPVQTVIEGIQDFKEDVKDKSELDKKQDALEAIAKWNAELSTDKEV